MYAGDFEPPRSGTNKKPPEVVYPPPNSNPPMRSINADISNSAPNYEYNAGNDFTNHNNGNSNTEQIDEDNILEYERVDCTPNMCMHPYALLRWFELVMYFILHWLVQVSCANTTCTMIINEFGDKAVFQGLVLLIIVGLAFADIAVLVAYSLNAHKAFPQAILSIERAYALGGAILLFICGIIGSIYAAQTASDVSVNELGRGIDGIRPQWIAAAVLEFLTALLLLADLMGQRREGFPFSYNLQKDHDREYEKERKKQEKKIREHRIRQSLY
jgi:hypothetical protein